LNLVFTIILLLPKETIRYPLIKLVPFEISILLSEIPKLLDALPLLIVLMYVHRDEHDQESSPGSFE